VLHSRFPVLCIMKQHPILTAMSGTYENSLAPFLWLHGEEDEKIVAELERIRECGIGAVCIESRTHEDFCGEGWWSDVALILDTCRRLGMKLWILDDKHFPSGYANGVFAEKYPEKQMWNVKERHVDICGPVKDGCVLADFHKPAREDTLIAAAAMKRLPGPQRYSGEVLDITTGYRNGRLYFDLPEGLWSIVLLWRTRQDMRPHHRIFSDKLDAEATGIYLREVYQPHWDHFADEFGKTLLGFFSDEPAFLNNTSQAISPMTGERFTSYPWHENVEKMLRHRYGERWLAMLCGMWFDFTDGTSERGREGFMDIVTSLYRDCFSRPIGNWCAQHGVRFIGHIIEDNNTHEHTGVGPGHYFRALDGQHMGGIDVVLCQIVPGLSEISNTGPVSYKQMDNVFFQNCLAKLGSSDAHTDPKKNGQAMCEIFGAYGWAEGSKTMKYLSDHMLVRGINYFVPHAFSPKENDPDCPPNFFDSGENPQYKYFHRIMSYQNRMCSLLTGGIHKPVCAIVYDAEESWATRTRTPMQEIAQVLAEHQLDYDILPYERLAQMDADCCIAGEHYPLVILPASAYVSEEHRQLLFSLPAQVIAAGAPAVAGIPTMALDKLPAYMTSCRDVCLTDAEPSVRYYHYLRGDVHLYVFAGENITRTIRTKATLGDFDGGVYYEYDAFENTLTKKESADGQIELILPPYKTVVIVTGDTSGLEQHVSDEPWEAVRTEEFTPVYKISLAREKELPVFTPYAETAELKNITAPDEKPDFSGNILYETTLIARAGQRIRLHLGYVGEIARLTVNGADAGVRMLPPYSFDLTPHLTDGENRLEILVSNTAVFAQPDRFSSYLLIEPSGILGPVTLEFGE